MKMHAHELGRNILSTSLQINLLSLMADTFPEYCPVLYKISRKFDQNTIESILPNEALEDYFDTDKGSLNEKFDQLFEHSNEESSSLPSENKGVELEHIQNDARKKAFIKLFVNMHFLHIAKLCKIQKKDKHFPGFYFPHNSFLKKPEKLHIYCYAAITAKGLKFLMKTEKKLRSS